MSDAVSVMGTVLSACHFFAAVSGASVCRECVLQKGRKMENKFNNITEKTTLGELIETLHLGEKPEETPTPKELRETAGAPVASEERCRVYRNGWAVYDNGSGRTVLWLPDCASFTYFFDKPDRAKPSAVPCYEALPAGLLASQPWPIAVTLVGDHRVEENLLNRTGSRNGTKVITDPSCEPDITEEYVADAVLEDFFQAHGRIAENPEQLYIWKETLQEMLDSMTKKQRKAFVLYYIYGYKEEEIARRYCVKKAAVCRLLSRAVEEAKKII